MLLAKGGRMGVSSCAAGLVADRRLREVSNSAASGLAMRWRGSCLCLIAVDTVLDST